MPEEKTAVTETITTDVQPVVEENLIAEKDAVIAKLTEEKENYRKGMLRAKGKTVEDDDDEDIDAKIDRKVQERLYDAKIVEAQQEKDELIKRQARELQEAKVALANRAQVGSSASGGSRGAETTDIKTEFFTADQIKDLERQHKNLVNVGVNVSFEDFKKNAEANILKLKN